jgi:hypothetical protein
VRRTAATDNVGVVPDWRIMHEYKHTLVLAIVQGLCMNTSTHSYWRLCKDYA